MTETVFITGATSGIGLGLAQAFHQRGDRVIVGGRDEAKLKDIITLHPGMESCAVDVADPASIERCAQEMASRFPGLTMLINNAGIQRLIDFSSDTPPDMNAINAEIDTNLRGLIQMTACFLPLLRKQPRATLVQVSSGLAYTPLAAAPVYSATKAAVHSFTQSLRHQLRHTHVRVVELLPPAVKTDLHRRQEDRATPPSSMELDAFIAATMKALGSGRTELPIGLARILAKGVRLAPGRFFHIINSAHGN